MKIVGKGLIGGAFIKNNPPMKDVIVFASGVSNSSLIDNKRDFEREFSLIKKYENLRDKFIYFSTSSIYDTYLINTPYVQQKIKAERYISTNFKNFLIYRLPIVVGRSKNTNTLTNYLYRKISLRESLNLHMKASRYLLDVDDVVDLVFRSHAANNTIINLNLSNRMYVSEIVSIFEEIIRIKAKIIEVNKGSTYQVDNSDLVQIIGEENMPIFKKEDYLENLLRKYYL